MSVIYARGQSDEGSRPPASPWKIHMCRNKIEAGGGGGGWGY